MKASAAQLIADQASEIAELKRGIGDLILYAKHEDHVSIENDYEIIDAARAAINELRTKKLKNGQ